MSRCTGGGEYRMCGCEYTYHFHNIWCPVVWSCLRCRRGRVDLDPLQDLKAAIVCVSKRHALLRARSSSPADRVLKIADHAAGPAADIEAIEVSCREEAIERMTNMCKEDWNSDEKWRCKLMREHTDRSCVYIVAQFSHAIIDGMSAGIFICDLVKCLNGVNLGDPLPIPRPIEERLPGWNEIEPNWSAVSQGYGHVLSEMRVSQKNHRFFTTYTVEQTEFLVKQCKDNGLTVAPLLIASMAYALECRRATVFVNVAMQPITPLDEPTISMNASGNPLPQVDLPDRPVLSCAAGIKQWAWSVAKEFAPKLKAMLSNKESLLQRTIPDSLGGPVPPRDSFPADGLFAVSNVGNIGAACGIDAACKDGTGAWGVLDTIVSVGNGVIPSLPAMWSCTTGGRMSLAILLYDPPDSRHTAERVNSHVLSFLSSFLS
ncbi:hypothetical protein Pelo_18680 [Pelomyxa schiedti]|nr:hypothetical protein Pelo_18680 [Pelomyxa schiedti]